MLNILIIIGLIVLAVYILVGCAGLFFAHIMDETEGMTFWEAVEMTFSWPWWLF